MNRPSPSPRLLSCLVALAWLTPLGADEIQLTSGETVTGAVIGETSKALHVLTRKGEQKFPRDEVQGWTPSTEGVTQTMRRRAAHLGQRLVKTRASHARSWLKRTGKGSEASRSRAREAFLAFEEQALAKDHTTRQRVQAHALIALFGDGLDHLPLADRM